MQPGGMQKKALSEGMISVFSVFIVFVEQKNTFLKIHLVANITTWKKSLRLPYELYYFWEEVLASESQVLMSHWKYGKKGPAHPWQGKATGMDSHAAFHSARN